MTYQSDKMASRRQRILETTQSLLSTGDGHFTMRDLAKQSGVATATLYNLYGGQDALVSDAVADIFEQRVDNLATIGAGDTVQAAILARQTAACQEIFREPLFAKKMVELYFNGEPSSDARAGKIPSSRC